MNRTLIAFVLCSLSAVSASGHHLHSPTQHYQDNFERVHQRLQDAMADKAEVKGQLSLLEHSDRHDSCKPSSDTLAQFQTQKNALRTQYNQDLHNIKKKIKRLKREEAQLMATRID